MATARLPTGIKAQVGMPVAVIPTDGETYQGHIASFTEHGAFIETDNGQVRGETWVHVFGILEPDGWAGPRTGTQRSSRARRRADFGSHRVSAGVGGI